MGLNDVPLGCRQGHVEMLRWARENGAPWYAYTRNQAAAKLGYTDDFGNHFQSGTELY